MPSGEVADAVITIRAAGAGDEAGIVELIVPIQSGEFGFSITAADQPDLGDIDGFYRQGAGEFWVADDGGRIVGTIALKDLGDGQGALRKMFVAASHRGATHGIAQRLLDTLLSHATAKGFSAVLLGTTDRFLAAHRFYEKNGFELIDAGDLSAAFPRMALDTRFYRRTV
ncbi:N-acetylglutamate synthase-like GNAT family acetyltransferase [Rhizobium sp. PP-F2F-G48]|nr:N-acetylglutamate synthase-like GNAT family acetyltransferase [Rhizobium sp. PP-F2F-G48]